MSDRQSDAAMLGRKVLLSSDHLPVHLSEKERFEAFLDGVVRPLAGACDLVRSGDRPVSTSYEFVAFADTGFMRAISNVSRLIRTVRHTAEDRRDAFQIGFNTGTGPLLLSQGGRRRALATGEASLLSTSRPLDIRCDANMATTSVSISAERLRERIPNVDDLLLQPVDSDSPAARHLRRYMDFLLADDTDGDDELLAGHIETTLVDLAVLTLGAGGDSAALAGMRGLRAARVRDILAVIRAHYADPAFSPEDVARRIGISPRYLQDLLQETGRGFSERVLELRLQHARRLLTGARGDHLKIIDIAMTAGFGDVSYFNRCFRRRFGMTPTMARGNGNRH